MSKRLPYGMDISGQIFGRLTVVSRAESRRGRAYWRCVCECGAERVVDMTNLRTGVAQSCGCLRRERTIEAKTRHGESGNTAAPRSREYKAWAEMLKRVRATRGKNFRNYTARGIGVCVRWEGSFETFLADMGRCPAGYSLDRIENDLGYQPGNCRWADWSTQSINRRVARPSSIARGVNRLPSGRFQATVKRHGISRRLGTFSTVGEAVVARDAALAELSGLHKTA